ncbi:MAG: DUF3800 domain-containing protein [Clostridium sp.]|nr:DUF3800 domain-containing protein [Clostridium sp.]
MSEKVLSIFIDESGDFGPYDFRAPFYLVAMVFHEQDYDVKKNISDLESHLKNLGYKQHAIHTGPLIRRESIYKNDLMEERKRLFNTLFHFVRKLDFRYVCAKIRKSECADMIMMTAKLSKVIAEILRDHQDYFGQFAQIIIYYDNGQIELTKILTSVFNTLYAHVEFRKVRPVDYKLFQVADLVCTMELLSEKAGSNSFSKSEEEFFHSIRDFRRNYLKPLAGKRLSSAK